MNRLCILIVLMPVLAASVRADGQSVPWRSGLKPALDAARRDGRPIVLLFTVGENCPNCSALQREVFESRAWRREAAGFVHVRVPYRTPAKMVREHQVLMATARPELFPTVYVLDGEGWPCFVRSGYRPGDAKNLLQGILHADTRRPATLRKACVPGHRELLSWYRRDKLPFGETLAVAALWPQAEASERLDWASILIGPAIARDGCKGGKPYLEVLTRGDPDGRKGYLPKALLASGRQHMALGADRDAAADFRRAANLRKSPVASRLEAEVYLAQTYARLRRPCHARARLRSAIALAPSTKTLASKRLVRFAKRRLTELTPCKPGHCKCK